MRSIWRTLDRRGLADIGLTCLAVFFIGLSYGAIAVASGFPLWVPAALSVLVLAGASEFLFIGIVAAGGSPIAAALAGLLVNSRHLPYGLALPPGVTGRGWRRLLGTHVMNDESVVFALAQPDLPAQARRLLGLRPRRAGLLARRRGARRADRLRGARHQRVRPGRDVPRGDPGADRQGPAGRQDAARRAGRRGHRAGRHPVPARRAAGAAGPGRGAAAGPGARDRGQLSADEAGSASERAHHAGRGRHGHPGRRHLRLRACPASCCAPGSPSRPGPPSCSRPPP